MGGFRGSQSKNRGVLKKVEKTKDGFEVMGSKAEHETKTVIIAAGQGCIALLKAARYLASKKTEVSS